MDPAAEISEGFDPISACRVEITVSSYFIVWDGRKEYIRGRTVSYVVDSQAYSIIDLEKDTASEFKWGSEQQVNFWVLTGAGSLTCKLASDAQFLDLLRASRVVKLFMVVGNVRDAAVNMGEERMPVAMNMTEKVMPAALNMGEEVIPRKKRIKSSGEAGKRGPYQCKRCFQFGHIEKGCSATQAELEQELPPPRPKKQRKSKAESVAVSTIEAEPPQNVADPKVMSSPGVTTRSMSSLSPTSPGPTTRRMASISPGGINRRIIIS